MYENHDPMSYHYAEVIFFITIEFEDSEEEDEWDISSDILSEKPA